MLNIIKYEKELKELLKDGELPAICNGVPVECEGMDTCNECLYSDDNGETCYSERFIAWCLSDDEFEEDCCDCVHNATVTCADCSHSYRSRFERKIKWMRQTGFLELHPDAATYGGVVKIFPCYLEPETYNCTHEPKPNSTACVICRKNYWMQEVE